MISTYSITTDFSKSNLKSFMHSISNNFQYLYAFMGKSTPWNNESDIPTPTDTVNSYISTMNDMIAFKRIKQANLSFGIRKVVWNSGTVYTPYNDLLDLNNYNFYVITSENRVYKCLDNNNGNPSTIEPTSTSLVPFNEVDGYRWQLMFQVSESDIEKWNNQSVIPVKILDEDDGSLQWDIQQNAVAGAIDYIEIQSSGSGYIASTTYPVTITGDGSGAEAHAEVEGDVIKRIVIDNRGIGYTYAKATIQGNAVLRPIISPIKGHGSSAFDELLTRYLIISLAFDKDENGKIPTNISYRQIGFLMNPLSSENHLPLDVIDTNTCLTTIEVNTTSGFEVNEEIQNTTANSYATIVEIKDETHLLINNINGAFDIGHNIVGQISGSSSTIDSIDRPIIEPLTGKLIYVENRESITRSENQKEDYKLIIAF